QHPAQGPGRDQLAAGIDDGDRGTGESGDRGGGGREQPDGVREQRQRREDRPGIGVRGEECQFHPLLLRPARGTILATPRPAGAARLVLAGGAFAVDSVSASRGEADLSHRIRPATPGVPAPAVTIGGAPTGRWTGPDGDVLSSVTIRAEGVERPAFGAVTVEASATDVSGVRDPGAPLAAGELTVEVQVTGDALGRALGMDQTRLGAADDPSL